MSSLAIAPGLIGPGVLLWIVRCQWESVGTRTAGDEGSQFTAIAMGLTKGFQLFRN